MQRRPSRWPGANALIDFIEAVVALLYRPPMPGGRKLRELARLARIEADKETDPDHAAKLRRKARRYETEALRQAATDQRTAPER